MKASRLLTMLPLAGAMLLAACGPVDNPTSEQTEKPNESTTTDVVTETPLEAPFIKEPTKITFWNTFSYSTQIEKIIKAFEKIEPNVTVENKKQTGSYDDLKEMTIKGIPANNYPDLVVAYPDHVAEYLDLNVAIDFDEYMGNKYYGWTDEERDDVVPGFLAEGQEYTIPGTYSLPMAKSTEAMFYNEKLLEVELHNPKINNGEKLSKEYLNNLTWEELFDVLCPALIEYNNALPAGQKLYKEDQDYHGIVGYDSDDNLFITLAKQYGYGYTSIDEVGNGKIDFVNPGMKDLMKTFNKAFKDGYIITKGTANKAHPNDFFTKSNCLFSIGSTGGVKYQLAKDFNVGVAKIPHAKGRDPYVINQGPSVAGLSHGDANRELATWLFYKFLTNKENSLFWATETGYMPIRLSNYEEQAYIDYCTVEGKADFSIELLTAKNASYVGTVSNDLFTSAVFKGSSAARKQVGFLMTNCLKEANLTDEVLDAKFQAAYDETMLAM